MEATSKAPCLRNAPHAIGWPSLGGSYCTSRLPIPRQLGHDRSTQDPPSPADEARVLRVTLSTLLPWRLRWLPASEAPYMKNDFGGSLPPEAFFIKSVAPCLPMPRPRALPESLGSGLRIRSRRHQIVISSSPTRVDLRATTSKRRSRATTQGRSPG